MIPRTLAKGIVVCRLYRQDQSYMQIDVSRDVKQARAQIAHALSQEGKPFYKGQIVSVFPTGETVTDPEYVWVLGDILRWYVTYVSPGDTSQVMLRFLRRGDALKVYNDLLRQDYLTLSTNARYGQEKKRNS